MSIDIRVSASMISVKRKGTSLADFRIEKSKSKKCNITLLTDKIEIPAKQSNDKVDKQKKRKSDCSQKSDIVAKKKERSSRNLMKYENRYRYLEKICHQYISPRDNQNNCTLEANASKASTLLDLAQEVLYLEREVNTVVRRHDCNSKIIIDDSFEAIDFLLELDEVKKRLLDELDLNLSNQDTFADTRQSANRSATNKSTSDESRQCSSVNSSFSDDVNTDIEWTTTVESDSSKLDEDEQMIDLLTEEILMESSSVKFSEVSSDWASSSFNENNRTNYPNAAQVLSDIPKIPPSFSRNSLVRGEKPPASLICKQYKRMDIDFTIHELSAIYETDSDVSKSQTTIAS